MEHETRAKRGFMFCVPSPSRLYGAPHSLRVCLRLLQVSAVKTRKITPVRQARGVETSAAEENSHVFQTSLHCSTLKLIHRLPSLQVVQRRGLRESVLFMT